MARTATQHTTNRKPILEGYGLMEPPVSNHEESGKGEASGISISPTMLEENLARLRNHLEALLHLSPDTARFLSEQDTHLLQEIRSDISAILANIGECQYMEKLAFTDQLTGLANPRHLLSSLAYEMKAAKEHNKPLFALVLDIDNFENIDHALGHPRGNHVLKETAKRLHEFSLDKGYVARTGPGQFTIVLSREDTDIRELIGQIQDLFALPIKLDNEKIRITISIGVASYPKDAKEPPELMSCARKALSEAKTRGEGQIEFYSKDLFKKSYYLVRTKKELETAIERRQFVLFYQPKINVKKQKIAGFEALIRWMHPKKGLVPPGQFIPTLESTGLIIEAGRWVIEEACRHFNETFASLSEDIAISFNVSVRQFKDKAFPSDLIGLVQEYGVNPYRLWLEVTETALMADEKRAISKLEALRDFGIGISIDDFGTGYSSLCYLKKIPASCLKIDMSFVRGLPDNREDIAIVKAIISLANGLGKRTVAEGVETKEQLAVLSAMGVDEVQGYYFSKPMPLREATSYLLQYNQEKYF